MFGRTIISSISLICIGLLLTAASLHLDTSANRDTKVLKIKVLDKTLLANLATPGTAIEKYHDGGLRHLSFFQVDEFYDVYFYQSENGKQEKISLIQQYTLRDDKFLLDGATYSFTEGGSLLTESHWREGKPHGKYLVYNIEGQLIEEKSFMEGYPVDTWSLYYSDGTLASTITFPGNHVQWEETESKAGLGFRTRKPTLCGMPFHSAIDATQVWYTPAGHKHKEKHYKLYVKGGSLQVWDTGCSKVYANDQVIQQNKLTDGNGSVKYFFNTHQSTASWLNGHPIRQTHSVSEGGVITTDDGKDHL